MDAGKLLLSGFHSGSYHLKSHRTGRLAEPAVMGKDRSGIKAHGRLEVQDIEGAQIRHGQESRVSVDGPVADTIEEPGYIRLF